MFFRMIMVTMLVTLSISALSASTSGSGGYELQDRDFLFGNRKTVSQAAHRDENDEPGVSRYLPLSARCQQVKNMAITHCHGIFNQSGKTDWDFWRCQNDFMTQHGCL